MGPLKPPPTPTNQSPLSTAPLPDQTRQLHVVFSTREESYKKKHMKEAHSPKNGQLGLSVCTGMITEMATMWHHPSSRPSIRTGHHHYPR